MNCHAHIFQAYFCLKWLPLVISSTCWVNPMRGMAMDFFFLFGGLLYFAVSGGGISDFYGNGFFEKVEGSFWHGEHGSMYAPCWML